MSHVVHTTDVEGFEAVVLAAPDALVEATFVPGAGMLGASLRHRGEELLHLPGGVAHYVNTGSATGIPLLYPWANRLGGWSYEAAGRRVELQRDAAGLRTEEHGLPIHGLLAAASGWLLDATDADGRSAMLQASFDFAAHPELLASFPFPHRLRIAVVLAQATLSVTTTVEPTGDQPVPISFGFHPYLHLPAVARQDWHISAAVGEHLLLDGRLIPTGEREPAAVQDGVLGERTFDDGYASLGEPPQFRVAGGGRAIAVSLLKGFPLAQIYAPKSSPFICFEPMTAPTNALQRGGETLPLVAPGERFESIFSIAISQEEQ